MFHVMNKKEPHLVFSIPQNVQQSHGKFLACRAIVANQIAVGPQLWPRRCDTSDASMRFLYHIHHCAVASSTSNNSRPMYNNHDDALFHLCKPYQYDQQHGNNNNNNNNNNNATTVSIESLSYIVFDSRAPSLASVQREKGCSFESGVPCRTFRCPGSKSCAVMFFQVCSSRVESYRTRARIFPFLSSRVLDVAGWQEKIAGGTTSNHCRGSLDARPTTTTAAMPSFVTMVTTGGMSQS
jgi:hypothetical protein